MSNPTYGRDKVIKIINSVLEKVGTNDVNLDALYHELKDLQAIIEDTRKEIGATYVGDVSDKHIPTATDELDAVVAATAEATGTIMDSCEQITQLMENAEPALRDPVVEKVTGIFEACSFQDITGQRITKVISSLKQIETKVNALLSILTDKLPGLENNLKSDGADTREGDARLLNGPQMSDKAISQSDIDKLLADF